MDKLIERLRDRATLGDSSAFDLHREAANQLELQARENDQLKQERDRRNKVDPITRLHNLCDGLADRSGGSPYSAEAWEQQDSAYQAKCAENDQLRAALRLRSFFRATDYRHDDHLCCALCGGKWQESVPESHAEGCLASPPALRDDHE